MRREQSDDRENTLDYRTRMIFCFESVDDRIIRVVDQVGQSGHQSGSKRQGRVTGKRSEGQWPGVIWHRPLAIKDKEKHSVYLAGLKRLDLGAELFVLLLQSQVL